MTLIDVFVVVGIALVLPFSLGGSFVVWGGCAVAAVIAFLLPEGGTAAVFVLPFVVVSVRACARESIAGVYAVVAAGALIVSRLGATPFGQREPIIELTAVHYIYAGAASLVLAVATRRRVAVYLTAAAPPVVAAGFLTEWMLPQVGGAIVMTVGIWLTAIEHVRMARRDSITTPARWLFAISGAAPWVSMVLAVQWATAQHWSLPALSIPDMARTHGVLNAVGFVACGLAARAVGERRLVLR